MAFLPDTPLGADGEGSIPLKLKGWRVRQRMKCHAWLKLLSTKSRLRIETWNVHIMYKQGGCAQDVKEMEEVQVEHSWSK